MRGIPSLVFDLELPIPRLRYRISHPRLRERSYIPRLQEGPSYHHLLHIEDLFLLVEFAN
ncbi:Hypothetical protein FKW44_002734 [Caligus rogercresseyi]|uniref:Uncharacterized protein n=1 Tax=Caligus rogercresseyi TaxID=217165 RepID=A0A7T8QWI4_CALRO|nr:Hypothetical protein FKW44_002734 [Caligus rogercresseyi]